MRKCKCGSNQFHITERDTCCECKYNGVYLEELHEYTTDESIISSLEDPVRTQSEDEMQCELDCNNNAGCWLLECSNCGILDLIARIEE